jgi:hypothetical protein
VELVPEKQFVSLGGGVSLGGWSLYVNFKELLETLNKKIWNPDLHFSEFEVAEVIRDLDQVEKVIYLTWRV